MGDEWEHPGQLHADSEMDVDSLPQAQDSVPLIVATDFGTTFSCVAFASKRGDIGIVRNYPGDPMTMQGNPRSDVPTESWYPNKKILEELAAQHNGNSRGVETLRFDDEDDEFNDSNNGTTGLVGDGELGTESMDIDPIENEYVPETMYWGYEVQDKLMDPDLDKSQYNCITRSKLVLDVSDQTKQIRQGLRPILKTLKTKRYIRSDEDVISQYLERLFKHSKNELLKLGWKPRVQSVEHVLCVPVIWSANACRKMQRAMEVAIQRSSFGSVQDLFLVSEPEAAAAYVLDQNKRNIHFGETFILLDAGGGTVDTTTYTVTNSHPLRLQREEVAATGGLYGSSYLNEAFREHLLSRLEGERSYLERSGITVEGIVNQATIRFENEWKRSMNVLDKKMNSIDIFIERLKKDSEKRFKDNRLSMNR
ncbi:Hsp70 family protein [Rutstroemia sp. NJR-2017a BBW]|nr:Hsp70 family protein [Rutstroemia sp. NJR-2017a BBW]